MSDLAWVAFIIIVYWIVIKPMMQGILQPNTNNNRPKPNNTPKRTAEPQQKKEGGEYVDYEEIK
ncbi:MAG: hypothetical protein IPL12_17200 [Bacteroidetes bacterium]|nr:hypothetical protein [Bacteroidota bacterium]MBK8344866.1 hypothetical protein [Bacteroidota bacterium]